jgi:2-dehydropantoate 2-reductase
MDKQTVFSIVGTGAVGGYYGALLQRAGNDVHFLLHNDYAHTKTHGLNIESCNGNFQLPAVNAYCSPKEMPQSDVVIVALKTTANHVLSDILPHLVSEKSLVLTLQNGLGSEEEIASIVGPDKVLGGLCFLCANKIAPGHIRHLDYGLITLCEYRENGDPSGITHNLENVGEILKTAGIPIKLIADLAQARWKKLAWNVPFNGMSVLHNMLTDELVKTPATRTRCLEMMHEVARAANVCARPIEPSFIRKMMQDTENMKPYAPSMKLDHDRGNPMEIESIYGNPIRAAKSKGVAMPETQKLYHELLDLNLAI